jgi:hypothetical protein
VRLDAYQAGRDLADPGGAGPRFALPAGAAVLARPDGYVAWIGGEASGRPSPERSAGCFRHPEQPRVHSAGK